MAWDLITHRDNFTFTFILSPAKPRLKADVAIVCWSFGLEKIFQVLLTKL